ncbi:MAG: WXG100 family type VII secretion target [Saccharofermentans sp.]|nr:WXG100 family type VII secretion target [Saccharofermentans sp.]
MDSIKVNTGSLKVASNTVEDLAVEYKNVYENLYSLVDELVSSAWTGPDANAFKTQISGFQDDFLTMQNLMNEYASFLNEAATNYDTASEDIKSQISGLQN